MHIVKVDPRALKDNPDRTRQSKSSPQSDALLLATIKAVGIIQPPVGANRTGTPLELYDDPANKFVAGFIGSPAMNFISGRVQADGLAASGVTIPLPGKAQKYTGNDVIIGIRPEHLTVEEKGPSARVLLVEPTRPRSRSSSGMHWSPDSFVSGFRCMLAPAFRWDSKPSLFICFHLRMGVDWTEQKHGTRHERSASADTAVMTDRILELIVFSILARLGWFASHHRHFCCFVKTVLTHGDDHILPSEPDCPAASKRALPG